MAEFRFDPPLTLKGNIVVRNLDDAVRFMIGYREARRPALQTSVLYRIEGAAGEADERHAGDTFRGWAEAEGLIINAISAAIQELPTKVSVIRSLKDSEDPESNLAA